LPFGAGGGQAGERAVQTLGQQDGGGGGVFGLALRIAKGQAIGLPKGGDDRAAALNQRGVTGHDAIGKFDVVHVSQNFPVLTMSRDDFCAPNVKGGGNLRPRRNA